MTPARQPFAGRRGLILEDDVLVGLELAARLGGLGVEVVGPLASTREARRRCADLLHLDFALLDMGIRGSSPVPLALDLVSQGLPVVLLSGEAAMPCLPVELRSVPLIPRPVLPAVLEPLVAGLITTRPAS
ncbi:MAG: hypothetical protein OXU20_42420 [Myxococcales bacterium]|nr:hypothetical protein [Myxococcales bacterium]MDD9964652.1 hypothetical protein [Myxococcales bacterium]